MTSTVAEQMAGIRQGAVDFIGEESVRTKLEAGQKLVVKFGADPTSPDLHLGHYVVLRKFAKLASYGHTCILVVGDFTATIGDPSGRSTTRPVLTREQVLENAQTYVQQVTKVIGSPFRVEYNGAWLRGMSAADLIELVSSYTVSQMLERDDFHVRFNAEQPISLQEFIYPLLQGHDSVVLKADLELGGTDQKFNLLVGRDLQRRAGQSPQAVITMPILDGTDGKRKMSKSFGNAIAFNDTPENIYGKVMSIPDSLTEQYTTLLGLPKGHVEPSLHPYECKKFLAKRIVGLLYNDEEAKRAEQHFVSTIVNREVPTDIPFKRTEPDFLVSIMANLALTKSKADARRLIAGRAVHLNETLITDVGARIDRGNYVLKYGKLNYCKLEVA